MIVIGDVSVGKTSMVRRFCVKAFDKEYKATIGVDFEVERFEILGSPFTLQMWDTAGQERFQCIAAAYYRGAHAVAIVFDISDIATLSNARTWLEAALRENQNSQNLKVFLVGTKKDLVTPAAYRDVEREAIETAKMLKAEYWGVSSLTGENVKEFFSRVAALSFEDAVLLELKKRESSAKIGEGEFLKLDADPDKKKGKTECCKT